MLANGDTIEIGNTTFRFDIPNGVPRLQPTMDLSQDRALDSIDRAIDGRAIDHRALDDEDEPSTVAGKPVRSDEIATPAHPRRPVAVRPKTMPPPAPLPRARTASQAPPLPFAPAASPSPAALTVAAASMPTMAPMQLQPASARPPSHQAPTMLGNAQGLPGMLPTTLPGQGRQMSPSQGPYGYAQAADSGPQAPQPLVINGVQVRDATSTALVPPTPYGGMPVHVPQGHAAPYVTPQLSRRTKLILGGAGLTLFAAIATIAIIKGASGKGASGGKQVRPSQGQATQAPAKAATPPPSRTTVSPIDDPKKAMAKPDPARPDGAKVESTTPGPKVEPIIEPPKVEPAKVATVDPPKVEPAKVATVDPPKVDPPKVDPPKVVTAQPVTKDPPKVVKKDPPKVVKKDRPEDGSPQARRGLRQHRRGQEQGERPVPRQELHRRREHAARRRRRRRQR